MRRGRVPIGSKRKLRNVTSGESVDSSDGSTRTHVARSHPRRHLVEMGADLKGDSGALAYGGC